MSSEGFNKNNQGEVCVSDLVTNKKLDFHKLITLKDMGGLCYPSYELFKIRHKSETAIKLFIRENKTPHLVCETQIIRLKLKVIKSFVYTDILSSLEIQRSLRCHFVAARATLYVQP